VTTTRERAKARFSFEADEPASFKCRLDRKRFRGCASPKKVRVKPGKHVFRVRAIDDDAGNVDPSVAKYRWKVKQEA
jgi:hypothetical protein